MNQLRERGRGRQMVIRTVHHEWLVFGAYDPLQIHVQLSRRPRTDREEDS
jgi:hypothetical protein